MRTAATGVRTGKAEMEFIDRPLSDAKVTDCKVGAALRSCPYQRTLSPLRSRLGAKVESTADADVVEMLVQEATRGFAAACVEHSEEIVVG
jgi:hypothetical protein